jgi:RHS repeat-associated protein
VPNGTDTYTYDAAGDKLRRVSIISGTTTNTDYIGGIQYSGTTSETIAFIQTEEGKAVPNGTTNYDYNYYLGDNLGNTRVTFGTKTGTAILYQQDDYYPFGLEINRTPFTPKNEYLYNKKELQEEFNEYDYGFRFYDPVIVHWNSIDPLAEFSRRWSPYNYVSDNPIRFIDPDGTDEVDDVLKKNKDEAEQESNNRVADQKLINQAIVSGAVSTALSFAGVGNSNPSPSVDSEPDQKSTGAQNNQTGRPADMTPMYPGSHYNSENQLIYKDGVVESLYNLDADMYDSVFTDIHGNQVRLPGVEVTNEHVSDGAGMTPGRTIHLDADGNNGLADLEHEYGHYLDFIKNFSGNHAEYLKKVGIPSIRSAWSESAYQHTKRPYEMRATRLAIEYFGPNSAIARATNLYAR